MKRSMLSFVRLPRVVLSLGMAALVGSLAFPAHAATTTYTSVYTGGTIAPGDTVLLNDGATVTGNVTANGTLQFNQSGTTLTISNVISGTATLSLTNTGTLDLTGTTTVADTVVLDMTTTVSAGVLQIQTGTGNLSVGSSGTGTLNVTGGRVTNSVCTLGENAGGVGTATVSSGTWATSTTLSVGGGGTGTLDVNGGSVTSNLVGIGNLAGGVGTATVSSGTWATSTTLVVGRSGTGTLNVTGGYVGNASGILGVFAGSTGTATVSSGTWANSGNLVVGSSGTGTLTMSGGLVSVAGTLSKGGNGTINLNSGGTLQIGTGTTGGFLGVSTLTNNGTLVFNRSDASTYSGIISGTGAVTKQGGGTLTLDGANSYSSVTTISGGVLALSGTGSIGTGDLNLGYGGVFDLTALTSGTYSLPSTGDLIGSGTLTGNGHTLAVLGAFLPGNSPGTVTVDSGFTLNLSNSGTSLFEITSPAFTAGTFDLVSGDGSVVFGGILNLAFSGGSYAEGTDVLQIFATTGGRSGNFSAVNATGLAAGQSATFNSATGFITVVPEPSTYAMALAGLACGGYTMFRRRKRA